MEEDNAIRAIMIGTMLFIFIMTLSVIIMYYNSAVRSTDILEYQTNYGSVYETDLKKFKDKGTEINGSDVRNIIRKTVEENNNVTVTIGSDSYTGINLTDTVGNVLESVIYNIKYDKKYTITNFNDDGVSISIEFQQV